MSQIYSFFSKHDKFVGGFLLLCNQMRNGRKLIFLWLAFEGSFIFVSIPSIWHIETLFYRLLSFFGFALCVFSSLYFEPLGTFFIFSIPMSKLLFHFYSQWVKSAMWLFILLVGLTELSKSIPKTKTFLLSPKIGITDYGLSICFSFFSDTPTVYSTVHIRKSSFWMFEQNNKIKETCQHLSCQQFSLGFLPRNFLCLQILVHPMHRYTRLAFSKMHNKTCFSYPFSLLSIYTVCNV